MQYEFKNSFDRAFKKLSHKEQVEILSAIDDLINYYDNRNDLPQGLGLKRIGRYYWEIRAGIKIRLLFSFSDHIVFYFVGNHDDIQRFIRT